MFYGIYNPYGGGTSASLCSPTSLYASIFSHLRSVETEIDIVQQQQSIQKSMSFKVLIVDQKLICLLC